MQLQLTRQSWAAHSLPFSETQNHSDIRIHKYFYGKKNIDVMAGAGIRHCFPELEPWQQPFVDAVAAGEINAHQFALRSIKQFSERMAVSVDSMMTSASFPESVDRTLSTAEGIHYMQTCGIAVHCLDDRSNLPIKDVRSIMNAMSQIKNYVIEQSGTPGLIHSKALIRFALDNKEKMKDMKGDEMVLNSRMSDDPALAARMLDIAGSDPAAILFGAAHAFGDASLLSSIGESKTVRIDLTGDTNLYADRLLGRKCLSFAPNFLHTLNDDTVHAMKPHPIVPLQNLQIPALS